MRIKAEVQMRWAFLETFILHVVQAVLGARENAVTLGLDLPSEEGTTYPGCARCSSEANLGPDFLAGTV